MNRNFKKSRPMFGTLGRALTKANSRNVSSELLVPSSTHFLFYLSRETTNSGAHSSARLISESGKLMIAFCADSA